MPQTLCLNLVHVIFSTKDRAPHIREEVVPGLHAYLAGTARRLGAECYRVGGMSNHVHLALRLGPTCAAAKTVSELKTSSSVWMNADGVPEFAWQRGYGLFSVSPAHREALIRYIDNQAAHHARRSFQDEMRVLCEKYHVALDERYAWS